MSKPLRALLIEDLEDDALLIVRALRRGGYILTHLRVDTFEAMQAALDDQQWDVIISDYVMPQFSALAALELLKSSTQDLPFIIVSGAIGEDTAVAAMRAGAHDYLMKDNLARLIPAIERELQEATNRRERRKAEELSVRLGRILDNSANEIFVFDAISFQLMQVNTGASNNLGYSAEELAQRTVLDLQPDLKAEHLVKILEPLISGEKEQVVIETSQRRSDGSIYPVEVRIHFSRNESPPVFVAIGQDIAERKRTEAAMRFLYEASTVLSSSLDYQTTLTNVARLAVPTLADWCVVDASEGEKTSRQIAVTHANPAKELLARKLQERYTPMNDLRRQSGYASVLTNGRSYLVPEVADELLVSLSEDEQHVEMLRLLAPRSYMFVPLKIRGQICGVIAFAITESNRCYGDEDLALAEELARRASVALDNARLYRETEQALQIRDQFLSIAAHELKTPITALLGYAQLMQRRAEREGIANERDQRALTAVAEQSRRLHRLITSLLDLSRMQTGTMSIERGLVDVGTLARQLVEELQPAFEHHTLVFRGSEEPMIIEGDELRLEQVLLNLLQNALKYSPDGGNVVVQVLHDEHHVHISVLDQGIGIPSDALPRIFHRFYRASNADNHQIAGMGVGLYVVKEIVALHNGTIDVESTPGQGSTFSVHLPLYKEAAIAQSMVSPSAQYGSS